MYQRYTFALLVFLSAFSSESLGQDTDSTRMAEQFHELQPIEIKAIRAGSNAPFATQEVKKEEIEKLNQGQDLPYLLQYTPSAVVTSDAGAGIGYTGLRIRGTDLTRINVTLNGIPVNDAESQGTFFVNLPDLATSTNSIQIQRGVGTSTNGPGAFGATMSISNLEQMQEAGAEGHFYTGSFNTQRYSLKAGTGLLKNGLQFDVRLSKITSDGYIDRSASDLKSLQVLAGWKISDRSRLRFMYMTGAERTGLAWNGVPQDSLATNRTYNELGMKADGSYYPGETDNYGQDYYQLFFDHKFNSKLSINLATFLTRGKGYYEEYKLGEAFADYGLEDFLSGPDTLGETDMIRQLWLDNYFYGAVASVFYDLRKTKLTFGGGWNQYDGLHYGMVKWAQMGVPADHRWYDLDSRKTDINAYLKAEHRLDKLILFGDLQLRDVRYTINGFRKTPDLRPDVHYTFFNPKAGLSYLLRNRTSEIQRLYASIAVANKEPNRDDFEASPTDLPKPEQLYDLEAGYELTRRNLRLGANFYYMYYKDQLVLTGKINDVGAYARTNVPESYRMGIELVAAMQPADWIRVQANATYSQNKILNFTEYVDDYDEGGQLEIHHGTTDIAFAPNEIIGGQLTFLPFRNLKNNQKLELDLYGKYVGRQFLDNTSNADRSINPYFVSDIRVRYSLPVKPFRELAATLALNNIFNRMYEANGYTFSYIYDGSFTTQNYYYPQAGFNWMVGLSMKW